MSWMRVGPATDQYTQAATRRVETETAIKQEMPAPATTLAVPTETARAQVNMALNWAQGMAPSRDGIFVIGTTAAKAGTKAIGAINSSWGMKGYWVAALLVFSTLFTGCLATNIVPAGNTDSVVNTPADISPTNNAVCNPFGNANHPGAGYAHGVVGSLKYLTNEMPRYGDVGSYIENGVPVDASIYFGKIDIPTRPFDRGFITLEGETLLNDQGNTLYEYFSLRLESMLRLQDASAPKKYQFGLLADDGANLLADFGNGYEVVINNDGTHPSKFMCSTTPVELDFARGLPIRIDYYQGPRYHIALVLVWREWSDDPTFNPNDPLCGKQGNGHFFKFSENPPTPQPAWVNLLARGWSVVPVENYELPAGIAENPCDAMEAIATEIVSVTPNTSFTNSSTITFEFASNYPGALFQCRLDNGSYETCTSPKTYTPVSTGTHEFHVRAADELGNYDEVGATHTWTVDVSAPTLVTTSFSVTSNTLTVYWTTNEPATTSLLWGLGGDTNLVVADDGVYKTNHSVTLSGLSPNATYSYKMVGTDQAGNTMTSSRRVARTNP